MEKTWPWRAYKNVRLWTFTITRFFCAFSKEKKKDSWIHDALGRSSNFAIAKLLVLSNGRYLLFKFFICRERLLLRRSKWIQGLPVSTRCVTKSFPHTFHWKCHVLLNLLLPTQYPCQCGGLDRAPTTTLAAFQSLREPYSTWASTVRVSGSIPSSCSRFVGKISKKYYYHYYNIVTVEAGQRSMSHICHDSDTDSNL